MSGELLREFPTHLFFYSTNFIYEKLPAMQKQRFNKNGSPSDKILQIQIRICVHISIFQDITRFDHIHHVLIIRIDNSRCQTL